MKGIMIIYKDKTAAMNSPKGRPLGGRGKRKGLSEELSCEYHKLFICSSAKPREKLLEIDCEVVLHKVVFDPIAALSALFDSQGRVPLLE